MPLTGREKATIFLSILGADTSARVLRYLPDELADLIAAGINHLPTPSTDALSEVMGEFKGFFALPNQKVPSPQLEEKKEIVEKEEVPLTPKRNYAVLRYERPQIVALIVSMLPEEEREEALQSFPRKKSMIEELLYGMRKNPISPKIEAGLKEQFKDKIFF
jgi:flagellar motor switch protein FliG